MTNLKELWIKVAAFLEGEYSSGVVCAGAWGDESSVEYEGRFVAVARRPGTLLKACAAQGLSTRSCDIGEDGTWTIYDSTSGELVATVYRGAEGSTLVAERWSE